ncbi:MAG: AraC family transcriptional regulator [Myxococcales bacterium]|nr:AraC family transcriptional regulator [Myxococcales bacterium]
MSAPSSPAETDDLVFASLPLAVIAYGTTLGLDYGGLVAISGIPAEQLRDPDALVDYESLIRLWEELLRRFPERCLGLEYASFVGPATLGVVGYACSHCRHLGQAIELYARYCRLADPKLTLTLERSDDLARVTLSHEPRVEAMAEPIEMMLAALAFSSRRMNPGAPPPHEVCFRHPRRHDPQRYQDVFETTVRFEAEWTGVCFPSSSLDLPIMGADPRVGKYLRAQLEAMHEARAPLPVSQPLDARVRTAIEQALMTSGLDQAVVARTLGMSARSLQRGLQALGTSFSEQLDAVRRTHAVTLLRDPERSIREVAFMLGYADPRAFYRSFRRWTGRTPAEYRRELRIPS